MHEDDLRRWITDSIDESAARALASEMPASELWSLLLWIMEQRSGRSAAAIQQQWQQDRFVAPSPIDQRIFNVLDRELFAAAQPFESIELSPLAPLGSCSSVALTTQNRTVSTVRGTEVISDPTNVLALESAQRLRKDARATIKLATSHRCVRAQPFPKLPGFAAHFRLFCLSTAGHETKDQQFTVNALIEHIQTHLMGLDRLQNCGYVFPNRKITLLATNERAHLADRIADALEDVEIKREPLEHEYYDGLRFMIHSTNLGGDAIPLIDGGAFDWLAELAANRKLVFIASAIGSQVAAYAFRKPRT
ncbi:MAG: hypothetical protein ACJ8OJ_15230 [Povalibacter sp.]